MKKLLIVTMSLLCLLAPACVKVNNNPSCTIHDYVETIIKDPECTVEGLLKKTCSICGDTKTETIPVKGHTLVNGLCTECDNPCVHEFADEVLKAPTCSEEGVMGVGCKYCEAVDESAPTSPIPTVAHDYVETVIDEATCQKEGEMHLYCEACGAEDTKVIPLAQHQYNKDGFCIHCGVEGDKDWTGFY